MKGKNVNASVDFKLRTCRSVADSLSINIKHEDSEMYKIIVNFSVFDLKIWRLLHLSFFICTPSIFNLTLTAGGGQRLRETSPAQSGDSREPGTEQLPLQDQ